MVNTDLVKIVLDNPEPSDSFLRESVKKYHVLKDMIEHHSSFLRDSDNKPNDLIPQYGKVMVYREPSSSRVSATVEYDQNTGMLKDADIRLDEDESGYKYHIADSGREVYAFFGEEFEVNQEGSKLYYVDSETGESVEVELDSPANAKEREIIEKFRRARDSIRYMAGFVRNYDDKKGFDKEETSGRIVLDRSNTFFFSGTIDYDPASGRMKNLTLRYDRFTDPLNVNFFVDDRTGRLVYQADGVKQSIDSETGYIAERYEFDDFRVEYSPEENALYVARS